MTEIIARGPESWNDVFRCERCLTKYRADQDDVQFDRFKPPGTYWFDGSAGTGNPHFFVECPECNKIAFVSDDELPYLLQQKVKERTGKT